MAREISPFPEIEEATTSTTMAREMPVELLQAAIEGDAAELIRLLGLKLPAGFHSEVPIDSTCTAFDHTQVAEHLQSVTYCGDTVLHILVTNEHNELASMVFQTCRSLLEARNKKQETPLHSAARVGNKNVIVTLLDVARDEVKDVLGLKNSDGETALHMAAKYGHEPVGRVLMQCNPEVARIVNKEGSSPLHIAALGRRTSLVKTMLECDARLGYIPDSNGLFSVHAVARTGNTELVTHFIQKYPHLAKLVDHHRRNLFHIAAEENKREVLTTVLRLLKGHTAVSKTISGMIIAKDLEGNTPLHIAAIKGYCEVMIAIWKKISSDEAEIPNNNGQTPFDLSEIQVKETSEVGQLKITRYVNRNGRRITERWFDDIMLRPDPTQVTNNIQLVGIGSVLVTTVTFAAVFTLPGGLNQDNGTPILGRRYIFKAFTIANTSAFTLSFISLCTIVLSGVLDPDDTYRGLAFSTFGAAASCMVMAFGLGTYVMMAPVSLPIAIIVLVITLLIGSPAMLSIVVLAKEKWQVIAQSNLFYTVCGALVVRPVVIYLTPFVVLYLFIFCLPFL